MVHFDAGSHEPISEPSPSPRFNEIKTFYGDEDVDALQAHHNVALALNDLKGEDAQRALKDLNQVWAQNQGSPVTEQNRTNVKAAVEQAQHALERIRAQLGRAELEESTFVGPSSKPLVVDVDSDRISVKTTAAKSGVAGAIGLPTIAALAKFAFAAKLAIGFPLGWIVLAAIGLAVGALGGAAARGVINWFRGPVQAPTEKQPEASVVAAQEQPAALSKESTTPSAHVRGLTNLGNTCYMNASLQVLAHMSELQAVVLPDEADLVAQSFLSLAHDIVAPGSGEPKLRAFASNFRDKHVDFTRGKQHDTQEFFSAAVDDLCEANAPERREIAWLRRDEDRQDEIAGDLSRKYWANYQARRGGAVDALLTGQVQTFSSHSSPNQYSFEPFRTIPVPVPPVGETAKLEDMLRNLYSEYTLAVEEGTELARKGVKEQQQRMQPSVLPPYLTIQLKRFSRDGSKNTNGVEIPDTLDMTPYMADYAQANGGEYELYAVVNHEAGNSSNSGHYTADIRDQDDKKWRRFDDSLVSEHRQGLPASSKKDAYLLVYRRKPKAEAS